MIHNISPSADYLLETRLDTHLIEATNPNSIKVHKVVKNAQLFYKSLATFIAF